MGIRAAFCILLSVFASATALAQSVCQVTSDFGGTIHTQPGNFTIFVPPGTAGTLTANCTPQPGEVLWVETFQSTATIDVIAPPTNGLSVTRTVIFTSFAGPSAPVAVTVVASSVVPPVCTLLASATRIPSGGTVNFTANCTPAADQIVWRNMAERVRTSTSMTFSDTAPIFAERTVRSIAYHGVNSAGSGPERFLHITIDPPSPSGCTATAAPAVVRLGGSSTLSVACSGTGLPISYAWSGPAGLSVSGPGTSLLVTPQIAGIATYTVTAANSGGNSAPVSVTVGAAGSSPCSVGASRTGVLVANTSVTLTAGCDSLPTTYQWSEAPGLPGDTATSTRNTKSRKFGPIPGATSGTITVTPAETTTYTVVATNSSVSPPIVTQGQYTVLIQAPPVPAGISVYSGDQQLGVPGQPLPQDLVVRVTDSDGNPSPQAAVNWTVVGGDPGAGSFSPNPSSVSGAQGLSQTRFTMGAEPGGRTVRACLAPAGNPCAEFTVRPQVLTIGVVSGDQQVAVVGQALAQDLVVRVGDTQGSAVAQERVLWSVVNAGPNPGTFSPNPTLPSDAQGLARTRFTMGTDAGGRGLRACLESAPATCATFSVQAPVAPTVLALGIASGDQQIGSPGQPLGQELVVRVSNSQGNPVSQERVSWTVVNPGPSAGTFSPNPTLPSDAQGLARTQFTMGADGGGRTLRACLVSAPATCVTFAVKPRAATITVTTAAGLVGVPGQVLAKDLVVQITETGGNPVPGEQVIWTVVNPGPNPGLFVPNPSPPADAQGLTRTRFTMGTDPGGRTLRACLVSAPASCLEVGVRSADAVISRPAIQTATALRQLAIGTPQVQLVNIWLRLDQLRMRRNPAVMDLLRVSVDGKALPPFSALLAVQPVDKHGRPLPQRGGGASADQDPFERVGAFVNGNLEIGKHSGNEQQVGFSARSKGLTFGADYRLPGDHVVGVAGGLMKSDTSFVEEGGTQDGSGYSLSFYGSYVPAEKAYIDFIAHAGSNKYSSMRRSQIENGVGGEYQADTRGTQYAIAVSAGYDHNVGPLTLNPYLRLEHFSASIKGFSERGDAAAIQVAGQNLTATVLTLGGQVSYALNTSWGVLVPNARFEWLRQAQGGTRSVDAQLVSDSNIFTSVPVPVFDRSVGSVSVGASAVLPGGVNGFANIERQIGRDNYRSTRFTVGARIEF